MKELLIDGDILLYQYGCTNQTSIDWGDGIKSEWTEFEQAKNELDSFLVSLQSATHTQHFIICFSSPPSFRYEILPTYKHNRKDKEKPKLYYELRDYMLRKYYCFSIPKLEGDDVIGILATEKPGKYIICSIDKDMKQIPGEHYNWRQKKRFIVTEEEADKWFYTQVLTGDSTDGYSGCPGIGPKLSDLCLTNAQSWYENSDKSFHYCYWECVKEAFKRKKLTEQDALVQARVARILRKEDYDFEHETIRPWNPEGSQGSSSSNGLS
jgi:5'-3' exonuclease